MIVACYVASFLLLLSGCNGRLLGLIKEPEFNIDVYNYQGDPVGISCVYDSNLIAFHQVKINGSLEMPSSLIQRLNNGKPLTIYFDGILSHLKANGSTFRFAREWFQASDSNICYFTYAYEKVPDGYYNILISVKEMVVSHRLQYAAKVARDFVLNIRDECLRTGRFGCMKSMSQVTMLGFSFGAHIASQACIYLYHKTGEKVGKLIGIDPAGISLIMWKYDQQFIKQGDAAYVQIIHTDTKLFGTMLQIGDVDIFIEDVPAFDIHKHSFAPYIHMATCLKKVLLIAEIRGKGHMIQLDNDLAPYRALNSNEVIVGMYSELEESKRGKKFKISLKNRAEMLRDSIAHVVKIDLSKGISLMQSVGRN